MSPLRDRMKSKCMGDIVSFFQRLLSNGSQTAGLNCTLPPTKTKKDHEDVGQHTFLGSGYTWRVVTGQCGMDFEHFF